MVGGRRKWSVAGSLETSCLFGFSEQIFYLMAWERNRENFFPLDPDLCLPTGKVDDNRTKGTLGWHWVGHESVWKQKKFFPRFYGIVPRSCNEGKKYTTKCGLGKVVFCDERGLWLYNQTKKFLVDGGWRIRLCDDCVDPAILLRSTTTKWEEMGILCRGGWGRWCENTITPFDSFVVSRL